MFDMDTGGDGGGPWISWKAKGSDDGTTPAAAFALRTGKDDQRHCTEFDKGVVVDIENMKTGWIHAPAMGETGSIDRKWNASVRRMEPRPGDGYKKALSVPIALSPKQSATWEDRSAGAWSGFTALVKTLSEGSRANPNKLPVIRLTGFEAVKYSNGFTSKIPQLEVVKWVDRPECLKADAVTVDDGWGDDDAPTRVQTVSEPPAKPIKVAQQTPAERPSQAAVAAATAAQAPTAADPFQGGDDIPF